MSKSQRRQDLARTDGVAGGPRRGGPRDHARRLDGQAHGALRAAEAPGAAAPGRPRGSAKPSPTRARTVLSIGRKPIGQTSKFAVPKISAAFPSRRLRILPATFRRCSRCPQSAVQPRRHARHLGRLGPAQARPLLGGGPRGDHRLFRPWHEPVDEERGSRSDCFSRWPASAESPTASPWRSAASAREARIAPAPFDPIALAEWLRAEKPDVIAGPPVPLIAAARVAAWDGEAPLSARALLLSSDHVAQSLARSIGAAYGAEVFATGA